MYTYECFEKHQLFHDIRCTCAITNLHKHDTIRLFFGVLRQSTREMSYEKMLHELQNRHLPEEMRSSLNKKLQVQMNHKT